jgi:predicted NUDIX family NTP pyrophosphohydrolase
MPKQSAGILLFRKTTSQLQVFLVHPGGPFFKNKDLGAWSIPKGEFLDDEDALVAAMREFGEETGQSINGDFIPLKPVKLKSGKKIFAWAIEGDIDHEVVVSNLFEMEWPPKSGKQQSFPEIDRAGWFDIETAKTKINAAQGAFIDELESTV